MPDLRPNIYINSIIGKSANKKKEKLKLFPNCLGTSRTRKTKGVTASQMSDPVSIREALRVVFAVASDVFS